MRAVVILVLLACVAYANSLYAPFVFDDLTSVQANQLAQSFSLHSKELLNTRSLLYVTYAFNHWMGGQNVFGYHLVNLLLHIINGLLVFAIARRVYQRLEISAFFEASPYRARASGPSMYALLAAAFFLLHPVQTEAVTYVSQRSELLSKLVYLSGLLFFAQMPEAKIGFFASLPVFFCLVLGLGFKENAVTLPAAIVLYDYIFIAKSKIRSMLSRWRFYLGLSLMTGTGAYVFGEILQRPLDAVGEPGTLRRWYYFLTELPVTARYVRLILFPSGLNLDHDIPPATSLRQPDVLLSILLIIGLIVLAWRWRTSRPAYAFSIFWFFLTILPYAGIIPIPDVMFEHRLYLPLAGICLSFPILLGSLESVLRLRVVRVGTVTLGVLLIATFWRNYVWSDDVRLFSDVVAKSPHKFRAYENLIFADMRRGQEEQAISVARLGIENLPDRRVNFSDTIGNLYLRMGRPADAVEYFKQSNDESVRAGVWPPLLAKSFNNLGVAYLAVANAPNTRDAGVRTNALRKARDAFRKSVELDSDLGVVNSLVTVNYELGEAAAFEEDLRKKLGANPNEFMSLYSLATLLSLQDRYPESVEYFRRAEQQETRNQLLYFNYAFALSKAGQVDAAIAAYQKALRIDPIFHEAHYNLAMLYVQRADYASAVQHLSAILSIEGANIRANMKLAEIYATQGKLPLARQHLQQVLKADPQDREALSLFARIGG
jgi:tetratricopeptide (TPR) repeat protein